MVINIDFSFLFGLIVKVLLSTNVLYYLVIDDELENCQDREDSESRTKSLCNEKRIIGSALANDGIATLKYSKPLGDILSYGLKVVEKFRGENTLETISPQNDKRNKTE